MPRSIKHILIVSLIFFSGMQLYAATSAARPKSVHKPLFYQEITKPDLDEAKAVSSFITQLRRLNLDEWSMKRLQRIKASNLLPGQDHMLAIARQIAQSKVGESFHQVCGVDGSVHSFSAKNNIERVVTKEFVDLCRVRFIENLISAKKFSQLAPLDLEYFQDNMRFYLLKDRRHLLQRYLKMLERNGPTHQLVSSMVTDAYIKFDIVPQKDLVSLLEIGDDLTGHIQNNGLHGVANFAIFEKELRALLIKSQSEKNTTSQRQESLQYAISFYEQNKSFIRQSVAWNYFLRTGQELSHQGQWKLAHTCLEHSHLLARGREQIEESLFYTLFMHVLKGDKQALFSFIDNKKLLKQYDNLDAKLQFWIAYSLEKNGKKEVSSRLFERLLTNSPLSFYTVIAQREYQILNDRPFVPPALDLPQINREDLSDEFKAALKRLRLWVQVEDSFLAESEIEQIRAQDPHKILKTEKKVDASDLKRFAMLHTTELLNFENAYLTSFKLLYRALDDGSLPVSEATIAQLFPAPYLEEIKKIDSEVDPLLILSLVRQESAFNPNARSHVGARGLMQLMPATARELKRGVKTTQLNDPKLNLRLGIRYFKRLLKKYDGNLIHSLAAYNAGQGNLKRWMETKLVHEDPLLIVESIPFEETRKYVKLIYRNIFFYKYLANEADYFKLPVAQSFNTRAIATASDILSEAAVDAKKN